MFADGVLLDWLNLVARLLHVVAGIAWIGASFYFIWLDNSLRSPPQEKQKRGVSGDLWAIHGGGIYEVAKYHQRPEVMPERLHWFKWEAYTTWLSGVLLLILLYYLRAELYLVGGPWLSNPVAVVIASVVFLLVTVACYECLLRTPLRNHGWWFGVALFTLGAALCSLSVMLFSGRAAYLHVGAAFASIMAANVFLGIIPSQKSFVDAVAGGLEPDFGRMQQARLRSTHNNYLTLPVVLCMISNHYPVLYGHPGNWWLLLFGGAILAYLRHFFNLKHRGEFRPQILWQCGGMLLLLFLLAGYADRDVGFSMGSPEGETTVTEGIDAASGMRIVETHCAVCHAATPTQAGFVEAPAGIELDSLAAVRVRASQLLPTVQSAYMPLGNITGMDSDTRRKLSQWLSVLQQEAEI